MPAGVCARQSDGRRRGHSAVAVEVCGNLRNCRPERCCIVAVCAVAVVRETAVGSVLASSRGLLLAARLGRHGSMQLQGRRKTGSGNLSNPQIEAGALAQKQYWMNKTYQFAWKLSCICVREGNYVVSYYKSQSHLHLHAKAPRLRTFIQESNCALHLAHSLSACPLPRHVQVVEHCRYGRYGA